PLGARVRREVGPPLLGQAPQAVPPRGGRPSGSLAPLRRHGRRLAQRRLPPGEPARRGDGLGLLRRRRDPVPPPLARPAVPPGRELLRPPPAVPLPPRVGGPLPPRPVPRPPGLEVRPGRAARGLRLAVAEGGAGHPGGVLHVAVVPRPPGRA